MAIKDDKDDFPKALLPLRFHGAYQRSGPYIESNADLVGTCPFCRKPRAFVAHRTTGKWVCHSKPDVCGRSGNAFSFLGKFAGHVAEITSRSEWKALTKRRKGIPPEAYKPWGVGFDEGGDRWIVPVKDDEGKIIDLRVMNPSGKKMGTAGRSAGLWNMDGVARVILEGNAAEYTLYICEGEWDGMPWDWLLKLAGHTNFVVCAVPGARVVKEEWGDVWKQFGKVVVMGDHDGDGDIMAEKCWQRLNGKTELRFLNWPDTFDEKFDVSDWIVANYITKQKPARRVVRELLKLVKRKHKRMPFKGQEDAEVARGESEREKVERPATNPTFAETLAVYMRHLEMTETHRLALQFAYSIYLSTQWSGVPLWGFLCGVPGCGKSEIACSIDGCPESVFFSSMKAEQLISGFKMDPDPSLIPKMIGKCSIFKDWTELLKGNVFQLHETYSRLRGWYDGRVDRTFGNGVVREYVGRGNMLACVTNSIHGMSEATVGERFLKFQMPKLPRREADRVVMSAMLNVTKEEEKNDEIKGAALAFLNRDMPKLDPAEVIPAANLQRILALANLIAVLRAEVEYKGYGFDKEVSHRPEAELPTRLGQQLTKLAMSNMVVMGKKKVDDDVFHLVERVAFNTAYGFNLDIVHALMGLGGQGIFLDDAVEVTRIPHNTITKRLEDLVVMGVAKRVKLKINKGAGRAAMTYSVVPSVRKLWKQAEVRGNHSLDAGENRRTRKGWNNDD